MSYRECFTLVFEGDLTKFRGNPLKTETPFGIPFAAGLGNAFDKIDNIEEIANAAQTLIDTINRGTGDRVSRTGESK